MFVILIILVLALQDGLTALMVAAQEGHTEIVRVLLQSGAAVNVQNKVTTKIELILLFYCMITNMIVNLLTR